MKRSSIRSLFLASALALLALGCVTQGTHGEVVDERDSLLTERARLQERVRRLEASSESLGAERVALIDEMEDLRQDQEALKIDIARLRRAEADLSASLATSEAELAQRRQEVTSLQSTYEGLVQDLESEVASGQIEIEQLREGLRVNLTQDVLFASGSAEVGATGRRVLAKVSERVRDLPHRVVVQGHTDDVPIASPRYPSNWELAGARASRVVRLLADGGVDPGRLVSTSFGEYAPRDTNETDAGRARNRRIEITLQPMDVMETHTREVDGSEAGAGEGGEPEAAPAP